YCIYISRFDVYTIGQAGVLATITGMILAILGWGFFLNRKEKTVIQEKVSDIPWGYYICTCFSVGIISAMVNFILLLLQVIVILCWGFFLNRKEKTVIQEKVSDIPWGYYIRTCFSVGIIAAMGHFILLLLQVIDMLTIVPGLVSAGVNEQVAMESKGIFDRG